MSSLPDMDMQVAILLNLDNVYDVIQHNAHHAYSGSEEADQKFIEILYDRKRTPDERAEILLSGRA